MDFNIKFRNRLQALSERQPHVFPVEKIPGDFRFASVLLPFWEDQGHIRMAAIVRSSTAPTHANQVAFPGGRIDDTDESAMAAALRETHEEIGIHPDRIAIFGRLDDAWSGGKFHIIPHIGWVDTVPKIVANPDEVEMAVIADVEPLIEPSAMIRRKINHHNRQYTSNAFELPGARLSGLSADLFYELVLWVRGEPSSRGESRLQELESWQAAGSPDFMAQPKTNET
jgi:8-oxo-dGTP pyrophosphatase MutT (NUDIX family)